MEKKVIDSKAQILGEISGIEVNLENWGLTGFYVRLNDDSITSLGFKKPRFPGKVEILIPNSIVIAVSDVVSLNKNHKEIRDILELRKEDD